MNRILPFVCVVLSVFYARAQGPKNRVISIPVEKNGMIVREPWTGGMDAPQFSSCDLNHDGINDLFVFDRVGFKVLTYLSNGDGSDTMFTYAPQYEELFPSDLSQWALIRDYNKDGIPDIFTYASSGSSPGVRVFKGSIQNGLLHFDLVCRMLTYPVDPFQPNIYVNIPDISAFVDVNHDGDLDILTYDQFGAQISYYENQHAENPGNPHFDLDSFKYVQITTCWGNISQSGTSNSITLNACTSGGEVTGQTGNQRHLGNSLYDISDPVYHDVDILNGNIGYDNLLLLRNCGSVDSANICEWDSIFQTCNLPMLMPTYPAAYGIDVNNDGLVDILMSPNATTASRNVKNVMYYKNTGDTACWYEYQSDSFLVHHTLDLGSASKPLFYDVNGDGLMDIISGNFGYFQAFESYASTLTYFQNIGTITHPAFRETSLDFEGISSYNLSAMNPALGDLNGDRKDDLIIGDLDGYLYYFKNTANTGVSFPAMTASQYFGLQTDLYAAPFIYDVNGDSLNDLLVGGQQGLISYYWNFGTKDSAVFSPDSVNTNFGNINVTQPGLPYGYSQPYIKKDGSGVLKLFVGSLKGTIYEYAIDSNKLRGGSFNLITSDFIQHMVGSQSTISIADINNDGQMEYVIGNSRGGLLIYSDSVWDPGTSLGIAETKTEKGQLNIYPNPVKDYFVCAFSNNELQHPKIEVFNILGEKMNCDIRLDENKIVVGASRLGNGFYIVRVLDYNTSMSAKVLIER